MAERPLVAPPVAPLVAIVGRPNVGKSTLFNRLVGKRLALVDDQPGVTRDRREGQAQLYDLSFRLVDTAGLEEAAPATLAGRMSRQSEAAAAQADVVLFMIDARAGLTPTDRHFANWLRKLGRPIILVANKCEGREAELLAAEAHALGLGEPLPLSAEHGLGLADLHEALLRWIRPAEDAAAPGEEEREAGPITLAVVGRPNVGKSTLVNRLLGEERLLTGPEPGITRDAIAVDLRYKDRMLRLVDTAGLRKRAKVEDRVEQLAGADSRRALNFAQVVILLVDAMQPLERQDLTIAEQAIEEGRALVLAVNKWDLVEDAPRQLKLIRERVERALPRARGLPVVTLSALQGRKLDRLLEACLAAYAVWNRRLPTAELNRWLAAVAAEHPPPAPQGRRIRLKYMTQVKTRPPTFALFASQAQLLPADYLRYLENDLRKTFELPGTPIRIQVRRGKNPYDKDS
jgi:GTP-binding protein